MAYIFGQITSKTSRSTFVFIFLNRQIIFEDFQKSVLNESY